MAIDLIINAKTAKISACNALDKVLIDEALEGKKTLCLDCGIKNKEVSIHTDDKLAALSTETITDDAIWYEEFLDYKIVLGETEGLTQAIEKINKYAGGHENNCH